mgnify:CR=1 FL=1
MIAIVEIRYQSYTHYMLYRSCLLIYGIAIVRLLPFDFCMILKEALTFL